MASPEYTILQGVPTPQVYHDLRKIVGLTPPFPEDMAKAVPTALKNTFAGFLAYERKSMLDETTPSADQDVVGMGRLVGDGGMFLMITDIAVHPDHRRKGIAKGIMKALVAHIDEHTPGAYVVLVADPMGQQLYPQFGFETLGHSVGMFRNPRLQNDSAWRGSRGFEAAQSQGAGASSNAPL
jgi:ribosomal protein S18 acetylase RimI-like enzyme